MLFSCYLHYQLNTLKMCGYKYMCPLLILDLFQSGFRLSYGLKTALGALVNGLYLNVNTYHAELSFTFDKVDHVILLKKEVNIKGCALD